jgi:hypothetical protein
MQGSTVTLSTLDRYFHRITYPATASESKGGRAADPEWHKRRLRRLPSHNRDAEQEIASRASDGIPSRVDEHRKKNQRVEIGKD